ncbi:hypothetical protein SAMN04487997_1827 [Frateuria terrea]|uniref:Uncharacterized protein n=1 Tax=Frateuria terrea TaxID=529704 RepID=A0A1H6U0I0_9GAMM|nr:hypothetical protein SAMN04487997_1827 [Frateuria terrea]SFP39197.1 hypothetical protein SAMN02927913_1897 [Frateuria terrea]
MLSMGCLMYGEWARAGEARSRPSENESMNQWAIFSPNDLACIKRGQSARL